jgi:O-antigen/teichoic acid export membrane protein
LRRPDARWLVSSSWPLLVNALLVSLFFRIDVFIVQAIKGDTALGIYDASYKLINLVTIVPAYVTLAIFPTLVQRSSDRNALTGTLRIAAHLLVWIAWGIVALTMAGAGTAIRVLAGSDYLPEAELLLRILIWFAPLSFLNGVVQYVLVALDLQRRIVPVFVVTVIFNLGFNLALVPIYGARAAAAATVLSEVVILAAIALASRTANYHLISAALLSHLVRPTLAGLGAAAVGYTAAGALGERFAIPLALFAFVALTFVLGVVGPEERALVRRALRRNPPSIASPAQ